MTSSPYRLAPTRAMAPVTRRSWPTWWLDVVGTVVALAGWPVARRRWRRAWEAYKRRLLADIMIEYEIKERELWARWWCGIVDRPVRLAIEDAEAALTKAPTRVVVGEDKARATARKGGAE